MEKMSILDPAWHADYRARHRDRILLIHREGMRQKRATDAGYCDRELAQQAEYRARVRGRNEITQET